MPLHDEEIIKGIIAGDEIAWGDIYQEYKPKLFTLCRSYVGDSSEIEDLIQTTWLDLVRGLPKINLEKGIAPILYEIARSNCKDYLRHKEKMGQTSLTAFNDIESKYYNIDISDAGAIWDAYKPKRKTSKRRESVGAKRIHKP